MKYLIVAFDGTNPGKSSELVRKYLLIAPSGVSETYHALQVKQLLLQLKNVTAVDFCFFMTKISTQAMSSSFGQISPDDNFIHRKVKKLVPKINLFTIPYYPLADELLPELTAITQNQQAQEVQGLGQASNSSNRLPLFAFNAKILLQIPQLLKESYVRPGKQDWFYLGTKTFGLNLIVRVFFILKSVRSGELAIDRAVVSTSWYQLQDAVFTYYGQTYMRFLGKMSNLLTLYRARVGEPIFVYFQLSFFEFLNRLILGPLGDNPLVYSWKGILLIFINNIQGFLSGGLLNPSFSRMREVGLIRHSTMMHLYQLGSLAMYFGLIATFGYQIFYTILTSSLMIFSWIIFIGISFFFHPLKCQMLTDNQLYGQIRQHYGQNGQNEKSAQ